MYTIKTHLKLKKAPGYDLIISKMIVELPEVAIKIITQLFNAVFRTHYFPSAWKISEILMIPKPGKDPTQPASYRPISLLPTLAKLFENMLATRITPHLYQNKIIPQHQFGFRAKHGTVEQVNRITNEIRKAFDDKKYCSAIFLDVAQAFDKVWHAGLIYKIKELLPLNVH